MTKTYRVTLADGSQFLFDHEGPLAKLVSYIEEKAFPNDVIVRIEML